MAMKASKQQEITGAVQIAACAASMTIDGQELMALVDFAGHLVHVIGNRHELRYARLKLGISWAFERENDIEVWRNPSAEIAAA